MITCQLVASMNPDSQARVAYPWLSHSRTCGRAAAEQAAERTAREAELRKAITDMQDLAAKLTPEQAADMLVDEAIATWRDLLVREGFDR
jgi:Spy/CpxP family protein refolding chaperone